MSADRLREAARVLRERAEAATDGEWQAMGSTRVPVHLRAIAHDGEGRRITRFVITEMDRHQDATFVATMHPGVAPALADWLDDEAEWVEADENYMHDRALAVANKILGSES